MKFRASGGIWKLRTTGSFTTLYFFSEQNGHTGDKKRRESRSPRPGISDFSSFLDVTCSLSFVFLPDSKLTTLSAPLVYYSSHSPINLFMARVLAIKFQNLNLISLYPGRLYLLIAVVGGTLHVIFRQLRHALQETAKRQ